MSWEERTRLMGASGIKDEEADVIETHEPALVSASA